MAKPSELPMQTAHLRWAALESGADGRSLIVQYLSAQRATGPARVHIRESQRSIAVCVDQPVVPNSVDVRHLGIAFTAMRRTPVEQVALQAPIAGRRIEGDGLSETAIGSFPYLSCPGPGTLVIPAVPSVVGLAVPDAMRVLHQQGFPAVLTGSGSMVVQQHPERRGVARNESASVCDVGEPIMLVCG